MMLRCRVPARACFVVSDMMVGRKMVERVASAGEHREVADDWKIGSRLGQVMVVIYPRGVATAQRSL